MKKITATTVASLMTALPITGAMAAAPATNSWSGFYGGLSVGYEDALVQNDGYTLSYFGLTGTPNPKSFIGGGFAGYNMQVPGENMLVGAEASLDFGGHADSKGPNGQGLAPSAHVPGKMALKGRVGYTGRAGFLPWFEAGVAAGRTEYEVTANPGPFAGNHGTRTALGVTTGVGLDYSFSGPLFARISYSYTHLGEKTFVRDQAGEAFDLNDFKVGLGYKF